MITQDRLRELLHYEPETGLFHWKPNNKPGWSQNLTREAGFNSTGYRRIKLDKKSYLAHRLVFLWIDGNFPDGHVDHIDGNKHNNRPGNLRIVSRGGENVMNVPLKSNNTSGHKGVFWKKQSQRWQVAVGANGKQHHIGYFKDKEEAIAASIEARNRFHGEFARHE